MLKWPGCNRVQITCKTLSAFHVQCVMFRATWYQGTAQLLSLTELKSHLFSFILLAETINRWSKHVDQHGLELAYCFILNLSSGLSFSWPPFLTTVSPCNLQILELYRLFQMRWAVTGKSWKTSFALPDLVSRSTRKSQTKSRCPYVLRITVTLADTIVLWFLKGLRVWSAAEYPWKVWTCWSACVWVCVWFSLCCSLKIFPVYCSFHHPPPSHPSHITVSLFCFTW